MHRRILHLAVKSQRNEQQNFNVRPAKPDDPKIEEGESEKSVTRRRLF
jgi:hypothetical protein